MTIWAPLLNAAYSDVAGRPPYNCATRSRREEASASITSVTWLTAHVWVAAQAPGPAGARVASLYQGHRERQRLAGPCTRLANQVSSSHENRNGFLLNGCRL